MDSMDDCTLLRRGNCLPSSIKTVSLSVEDLLSSRGNTISSELIQYKPRRNFRDRQCGDESKVGNTPQWCDTDIVPRLQRAIKLGKLPHSVIGFVKSGIKFEVQQFRYHHE